MVCGVVPSAAANTFIALSREKHDSTLDPDQRNQHKTQTGNSVLNSFADSRKRSTATLTVHALGWNSNRTDKN
eukprot:2739426-Amphidinium_carterae.1